MNWKRRSLLLAACGLMMGLAGCGGGDQTGSTSGATDTNAPAATAAATAPGDAATNAPAEPGATADTAGTDPVKVVMETSKGTIELELDPKKAPITVKNFLGYVEKGHYNGTIFHRVIPGFMIQGGGYTPDMKEKETGEGIKNEAGNGLKNLRGTISMARTSDPDSATAQFFISVADNASLDHQDDTPQGMGYAVFGKVTKGLDVADKIVSVPTTQLPNGMGDVPVDSVTLKSVKVVK
ncbi:MAG: peptidylprolyl isomerase [Armatimonadetes bacterium]|nr:peptidylprolyl isomerase [Armatimonadota bacterium]